jgi:hypothetical protein
VANTVMSSNTSKDLSRRPITSQRPLRLN